MSRISALLLAILGPTLIHATTLPPSYGECKLLDEKVRPAITTASTRDASLSVLEHIANGRAQEITDESTQQLGLLPGVVQQWVFDEARICAVRNLGTTGLPEAVSFLKSLLPADAAITGDRVIWAVQIALRESVLVGFRNQKSRVTFLENLLQPPLPPGVVGEWATQVLCDSGDLAALPRIREIYARLHADETEIRYCEDRMHIVARDPNRAKALGTVFGSFTQLEGSEEGERLLYWATRELGTVNSPGANTELKRIAAELNQLHKSFPSDSKLFDFAAILDTIVTTRQK